MAKKSNKKSWVVRIRQTVEKELICEPCTEEEARNEPWKFMVDETEIYFEDGKVLKVTPND